jgi:hypothetical protein
MSSVLRCAVAALAVAAVGSLAIALSPILEKQKLEAKVAALETRLSMVEERSRECRCQRGARREKLGDFPPWYGNRPGDEPNLAGPSRDRAGLPSATPR